MGKSTPEPTVEAPVAAEPPVEVPVVAEPPVESPVPVWRTTVAPNGLVTNQIGGG